MNQTTTTTKTARKESAAYQEFCISNGWSPGTVGTCGRLVHKAFPQIKSRRRRINDRKGEYVYKNLFPCGREQSYHPPRRTNNALLSDALTQSTQHQPQRRSPFHHNEELLKLLRELVRPKQPDLLSLRWTELLKEAFDKYFESLSLAFKTLQWRTAKDVILECWRQEFPLHALGRYEADWLGHEETKTMELCENILAMENMMPIEHFANFLRFVSADTFFIQERNWHPSNFNVLTPIKIVH